MSFKFEPTKSHRNERIRKYGNKTMMMVSGMAEEAKEVQIKQIRIFMDYSNCNPLQSMWNHFKYFALWRLPTKRYTLYTSDETIVYSCSWICFIITTKNGIRLTWALVLINTLALFVCCFRICFGDAWITKEQRIWQKWSSERDEKKKTNKKNKNQP